ncbi:MAG: MBL fold metallo-hydrolase [Treponema sp.]|nr:MBL fold metallo-hydrolase [Treponema sp.]
MKKNIIHLNCGMLQTSTYIIKLIQSKKDFLDTNINVMIIDPADCYKLIYKTLQDNNYTPVLCVLTHAHADHLGSLSKLKKDFPNMKIAAHEAEKKFYGPGSFNEHKKAIPQLAPVMLRGDLPSLDYSLKDGDILTDAQQWQVIHTPGHSSGSICLYNKSENMLITGDTFFDYGIYGRTDLFSGSDDELVQSLQKIMPLVKTCDVYPGH